MVLAQKLEELVILKLKLKSILDHNRFHQGLYEQSDGNLGYTFKQILEVCHEHFPHRLVQQVFNQ